MVDLRDDGYFYKDGAGHVTFGFCVYLCVRPDSGVGVNKMGASTNGYPNCF